MKTCNHSTMRLVRIAKLGSALVAALFTTCALQAQYTGPTAPLPPLNGNPNGVSHAATAFMQDAAQANLAEMARANIAQARGQNSSVRELAKTLGADHQKNYDLLQVMAQNHLVLLDGSPDWENQRALHDLDKASVGEFDMVYTKGVLKDDVKYITRFDRASAEIEEPYVREYAQNTLPTLRKELRQSEKAARAVGVDEGTISSILKGLRSDELLETASVSRH